jgi:hypothetical protein
VIAYGFIGVAAFVGAPLKALAGLALLAAGVPFYYLFKAKQ